MVGGADWEDWEVAQDFTEIGTRPVREYVAEFYRRNPGLEENPDLVRVDVGRTAGGGQWIRIWRHRKAARDFLVAAEEPPSAERLIEMREDWWPEPGDAAPVLVAEEGGATLSYWSSRKADGRRIALSFTQCLEVRLGYPNDEALVGHPLYELGLRHYKLYEVLGSKAIERMAARNAVAFPNAAWPLGPVRHFVITFHDSTFECLAADVGEAEVPPG